MVVYDDGTTEPVRIFDHGVVYKDPETFGEHHLSYRTGDILSPKIAGDEPLALELEDFLSAIRFGTSPVASGSLAREVVRVTEAADESLRQGGEELPVAGSRRFERRPLSEELATGRPA
jgi:predicted dehydrogenase